MAPIACPVAVVRVRLSLTSAALSVLASACTVVVALTGTLATIALARSPAASACGCTSTLAVPS